MSNIAEKIIRKCGGVKVVAELLGITTKSVHCWKYPKERGGSDGKVPSRHQQPLLDKANKKGISLSPDDFFYEHLNGGTRVIEAQEP